VGVFVFVPLGYWLGGLDYWGEGGLEPHPQGAFVGILAGFIAADFVRYLVVVYLAWRNGMSGVRYDAALSVLIVLLSPAAYYGGAAVARPLATACARLAQLLSLTTSPKLETFLEFFCQGIAAVLLWGLVVLAWRAFQMRPARAAEEVDR
jgi:hypothetical protein